MKKYCTESKRKETRNNSETKEGYLDWSHLAEELPSKTRY